MQLRMDDLVRLLLEDLSFNLDRLADELEGRRPELARTLRIESTRTEPLVAREPIGPPPQRRPRRAGLRGILYRALEEGAVDASRFDRLMIVATRARQGVGSPSDSESAGSSPSSMGGAVVPSCSMEPGACCVGSPVTASARR